MTTQTRESILLGIDEFNKDHGCRYADRVNRITASLSNTVHLGLILEELERMHVNDECPPTHVGNMPTRQWSEWVDDTSA